MTKKNKREVIAGILIFCVIIFLLLISGIKVPHSLSIYAEVYPLQKWQIVKGTDGQLTSALMDYETGFSNVFGVIRLGIFTFIKSPMNGMINNADVMKIIFHISRQTTNAFGPTPFIAV